MIFAKIPIFVLAAVFTAAPTIALAWDHDDDDEEEIPFEEAELFFELNDTDGDLGIHGFIDGDEWKYLEIEDPRDRKMAHIWVRGRLRRQGLTELFFESAEPCFEYDFEDCPDPLDPEVFFNRFPEGEYDIEGYTLDGEERESEVYLSHVIPAAPDGVEVNGSPEDEECPEVEAPVTLTWEAVTDSHEELGRDNETSLASLGISVLHYEVVVEIDETDFKSTTIVPADVYEADLPEAITNLIGETEDGEGEFKYEILVRIDNGEGNPGNKSAMESCFIVD